MFLHVNKSAISIFSLYILIKKIKKKLSLSVQKKPVSDSKGRTSDAETLSCTSLQGSMTVEAAFVLPIALFAILVMLGLFVLLQIEGEMTEALQYASRMMAVKCAVSGYVRKDDDKNTGLASYAEGAAAIAAGRKKALSYLEENGCWMEWIEGEKSGISFMPSTADGDFVNLRVRYQVKLPVSYWGIGTLPVTQGVCARKWTGKTKDEDSQKENGWVYVTKTGTAYHNTLRCRYLNLSIRSVRAGQIDSLRNKSGGKYYPCSCVRRHAPDSGIVFITDYGVEYHSILSCSNLKRTIKKIRKSEAAGYHACSGCAK